MVGWAGFRAYIPQYVPDGAVLVLPNGHNIFLDAGLEQVLWAQLPSVPLLGSFVLFAITDQLSDNHERTNTPPGHCTGLLIMLVHGLVENAYGRQAVTFLFALPG